MGADPLIRRRRYKQIYLAVSSSASRVTLLGRYSIHTFVMETAEKKKIAKILEFIIRISITTSRASRNPIRTFRFAFET